jgi:hypothetical protein
VARRVAQSRPHQERAARTVLAGHWGVDIRPVRVATPQYHGAATQKLSEVLASWQLSTLDDGTVKALGDGSWVSRELRMRELTAVVLSHVGTQKVTTANLAELLNMELREPVDLVFTPGLAAKVPPRLRAFTETAHAPGLHLASCNVLRTPFQAWVTKASVQTFTLSEYILAGSALQLGPALEGLLGPADLRPNEACPSAHALVATPCWHKLRLGSVNDPEDTDDYIGEAEISPPWRGTRDFVADASSATTSTSRFQPKSASDDAHADDTNMVA